MFSTHDIEQKRVPAPQACGESELTPLAELLQCMAACVTRCWGGEYAQAECVRALKGLTLPCASHSGEIALYHLNLSLVIYISVAGCAGTTADDRKPTDNPAGCVCTVGRCGQPRLAGSCAGLLRLLIICFTCP